MPQPLSPEPAERTAYGFVGTGEIAAALVEGLSADVDAPPPIFLSPRGREIGQRLAARFPNVRVCGSNQEVLDRVTSVVFAVRAPLAREVLAELSFRPDHVLISAMAGVRLADLRDWAAPAGHAVRSIPLPSAASGRSVTVVYPEHAAARDLFGRVGDLVVPDGEQGVDAFSGATATFAAHLDYLATIAHWLADHGVDPAAATAYTTHIFGRLGETMLRHDDSLEALTEKHMTPGGLNEQVLTDLRRDGVPDVVRRALDRVLDRLRQ